MTDDQGKAQQTPGASAEANIAALAMALIVGITLANVLVRYFTNVSLAWTEEISVFMLLVLAMAGCAAPALEDRLIRIDFFYKRGSAARVRALGALSASASTLMFGVLAALLWRQSMDEFRYAETTAVIGLPRWWFTGTLAALAALVGCRAAACGVRHWSRGIGPEASA